MADLKLRLFGQVGWSFGDQFEPIRGPTRLGVILSLAEARGATVSVDSLLGRLWKTPPRSGANAVQRHISALRGQLNDLGLPEPNLLIEGVHGGYRLGKVATDLEIVERMVQNGSGGLDAVPWWDEPLIGAPWEQNQPLRSHLAELACQALLKWSDGVPSECAVDVSDRAERILAHAPDCAPAIELRHRAHRRIRESQSRLLNPMGVEKLREVAGLWVDGQGSAALDALDPLPQGIPADLARRLCRALIWLDPQETWAHHVVSCLVEEGIVNPVQHERAVVSLDARVLEERPDGLAAAREESDAARSEWDLVRSVRVEFMLSLSSPHDESHDKLIEKLGSIDHPDAQVESRRFRFLTHLRLGEIANAQRTLHDYQDAAARYWPGTGDDFAPMAAATLERSIDARAAAAFGPDGPRLGAFACDRWALPFAETTRRLIRNDPGEPLSDTDYHLALGTVSRSGEQAMHLLRALNAGRPVEAPAHELAEGMSSAVREKQFMFLPIALCLVAEALRDRSLANHAAAAIEPWSGQMLGMWPVDFFFGPADDWLERLAAL